MYKKSIGTRLLAFIIDIIIIYLLSLFMYLLFGFGTLVSTKSSFSYNLNMLELTIASMIYFVIFALITKGRTIGKLVTKINIKNENLEGIPTKTTVLREVLKSLLMVISIISFIFMLVSENRKSIHDLLVGSIVVRRVNKSDFIEPVKITQDKPL